MQDLVVILCEYLYDNPTIINDVFLIYKIINLSCLLLVHNYYETLVVEKNHGLWSTVCCDLPTYRFLN